MGERAMAWQTADDWQATADEVVNEHASDLARRLRDAYTKGWGDAVENERRGREALTAQLATALADVEAARAQVEALRTKNENLGANCIAGFCAQDARAASKGSRARDPWIERQDAEAIRALEKATRVAAELLQRLPAARAVAGEGGGEHGV